MDVEDEANSYLKYLNDSDAPNTYLLGNNEVGLFSVEPIFTEMEASDWPQEGFPLLLTNSLMDEEDQETSSQGSVKNNEVGNQNDTHTSLQGATESSEDNGTIENQIKLQDNIYLDENALCFGKSHLVRNQEPVYLNENCVQITISENQDNYTIQPVKNDNQSKNIEVVVNKNGINKISKSPYKTRAQVKRKQSILLVDRNNLKSDSTTEQLEKSKGGQVSLLDPSLKSKHIVLAKKKNLVTEKKVTKSINDLFSTVIANKCNICDFLCEDLEQIKKHIGEKHTECLLTHNGLATGVSVLLSNLKKKKEENSGVKEEFTIFVCRECHSVCTDKNTLKQHMIQEHQFPKENDKDLTTDLDPKPPLKKMSMLSDINIGLVKRQEKALKKVKCTVSGCAAGFPTLQLCTAHTKLHIGNTRTHFKCQKCDKTFMMWRIARSHMYKEHGIDFGMIVCPMCNAFKSYREATILRHMMIHSEQKPFICEDCGKGFKQLSQLKNHQILHKTPEDMPTWARVKKCDKCHRFFANSKCLKKHIQAVHEKFKPFICNICGHQTTRKAMLELHLRQHTGVKPFKCEECNYSTRDHNCLRRHVMKHFGAATYQCPYCPFRCIQASSIKDHLVRKHKEMGGTFSCKYCTYSTINQSYLHSHEKLHEINAAAKGADTEPANATARERRETDPQTDEETQSCFLNTESQMEETIDNGGITIPAGLEIPLVT